MHQFKPKMTGGLDQSSMPLSPEAHKEWKDQGGKHVINSGIGESPDDLKTLEKVGLKKNEQSENRGMKNKDPKAESKVNPFYNNKGNKDGGYSSPTGKGKHVDAQASSKSSKRGP